MVEVDAVDACGVDNHTLAVYEVHLYRTACFAVRCYCSRYMLCEVSTYCFGIFRSLVTAVLVIRAVMLDEALVRVVVNEIGNHSVAAVNFRGFTCEPCHCFFYDTGRSLAVLSADRGGRIGHRCTFALYVGFDSKSERTDISCRYIEGNGVSAAGNRAFISECELVKLGGEIAAADDRDRGGTFHIRCDRAALGRFDDILSYKHI